jgi:hypothetical protein
MDDVRKIIAEFAARDLSGNAFSSFERKLTSFQKTTNSIAKIGRMASFVYLINQIDDIAESLQKASYNGENLAVGLLKSLPVLRQIDQVTSNVAKSLADIATHGQITSTEKMNEVQSSYRKLFDEMKRASEFSEANAKDAARLKIEYSYKDRIDEINRWSENTKELTKHNDVLLKQIKELEAEKKLPLYSGFESIFTKHRTESISDIDKKIAELQNQIITYDTTTQKANLLAAASAERSSALSKIGVQSGDTYKITLPSDEDIAAMSAAQDKINQLTMRMYEDMGSYGKEYFDLIEVDLAGQVDDYVAAGGDIVLAEQWKANQLAEIEESITEKTKKEIEKRKSAVEQWEDAYSGSNIWDRLSEDYARGLDDMGSKLTDWMKTSKMDWEGWCNSLLTSWMDTLNKMAIATAQQELITPLIKSAVGGIIGAIGGGGFGAGGSDGAGTISQDAVYSHEFHRGGIVGGSAPVRVTSSSVFANAPRLHSGLRSNEFPAILEKGEEVIPKNRNGQGMNFSPNMKVVIVRNEREAYLEAMNSAEGEKVIVKHVANNRNLLG